MLKKTITYEDFNGDTVTEDFFFHMSRAELVELELSHPGGLSASLERIIKAENGKEIIATFKEIILGAYGKRSDDGKRFVKNQQIREEFESSEAYSVLFMEIVTNTSAAIDFVNGIVPQNLAAEMANLPENQLRSAVKPPLQVEDGAVTHHSPVPTEPVQQEPVQEKPDTRPSISRTEYEALQGVEKTVMDRRINLGEVRLFS